MPKVSKISRKDLANLSTRETMALAREVYGKLFRYMKPYRMRFFMGIFFGILSGFSNAVMVFVAVNTFPGTNVASSYRAGQQLAGGLIRSLVTMAPCRLSHQLKRVCHRRL